MAILGYCPKCGNKVSPWFDTCKKCGEKLPGPKSPAVVDNTIDTKAPRQVLNFDFCPYCGVERGNHRWFDSCQNCGAVLRVFPNDRFPARESRNYESPHCQHVNTKNLHIPSPSEFIAEANALHRRLMMSLGGSSVNNFIAINDLFPAVLKCSEWPLYYGEGVPLRKVDCWALFSEQIKVVLDCIESILPELKDFSEAKSILTKIIESEVFDEDSIIRAMKLLSDINETVVRKERRGVDEYQALYSSCKSKCCKCGGVPEPGLVSLCQMNGMEGSDGEHWLIEFDLPVCRSCENKRQALLDGVYAKRAEAQAQYEKKKKLMDFICFGRDKVLREAYEPIRATYAEADLYSLDNYYKDFPVIAKLLSKRYSFGGRYDTGIRGRGDFSKKPENELRLV